MRRPVAIAALVLLLGVLLVPPARAATPDLPLARGDFAGSFGVGGGRTMYLECFGQGSPTVVLDAGLRNGASFWNLVEPGVRGATVLAGVSRFTRVCAYDRPGTLNSFEPLEFSRSSPLPMPRTTAEAATDAHQLLAAARVPGPFVLVGHSTGGLIDRQLAADHPGQVAGLVQVDALAEFLGNELDRTQLDAYEALNNDPVEGIDYPDIERIRFRRSFAEMRKAAARDPLADIPVSVLSHGKPFALPEVLPGGLSSAIIEGAWSFAQDKLAALTPDAVHVVARGSSHYIMLSQPKLVTEQVRRVVREVRRRDR